MYHTHVVCNKKKKRTSINDSKDFSMWGFVGHDEPFKTDPRSDFQFSSLAAIHFLIH